MYFFIFFELLHTVLCYLLLFVMYFSEQYLPVVALNITRPSDILLLQVSQNHNTNEKSYLPSITSFDILPK